MGTRRNANVAMPPGEYILGDPRYAVSGDFQEEYGKASRGNPPKFTVRGQTCLSFLTAHGNGNYTGSDGHAYPVDSGRIGLVPRALAQDNPDGGPPLGGRMITFGQAFTCSADYRRGRRWGRLRFGHVSIDTG